jgi:hypothetical protein
MLSALDRSTLKVDGFALAQKVNGLISIPEASGRTIRWRISDTVAVKEFQHWSSQNPRHWRAFIWTRNAVGRRQIEQAAQATARSTR